MKELTKTRRLIIASLVFMALLVIGFITFRSPDHVYKISTGKMLDELIGNDYRISAKELQKIKSSYVLVDVRNPYEYNKGTLEGAINIPVSDILNDEIINLFDDWEQRSIVAVLFAEDQQSASAPWMILTQLGYSNIKIFNGGFSLENSDSSTMESRRSLHISSPEEPLTDFGKFVKEISGEKKNSVQHKPVPIIPVERKKRSATEGGC